MIVSFKDQAKFQHKVEAFFAGENDKSQWQRGYRSVSWHPVARNPNSSNQLNFRGIGPDLSYTLELKKVTGELLYHQTVNTHSIALPNLEKGIYLITLQSEGNVEPKTFKYFVM